MMKGQDRKDIYYWKCDREYAFHGTSDYLREHGELEAGLGSVLSRRYGAGFSCLRPASEGQGNHRTFRASVDGREVFLRVEDGREGDNYLAVEAEVTRRLAELGLPVPKTIAYDCRRDEVPFAWQVMECLPYSDLNRLQKSCGVDWRSAAPGIGRAIARWQDVSTPGFGPFSACAAERGELVALHPSSEEYYRLNLDRHLGILVDGGFFDAAKADRVRAAVDGHAAALRLERGVLVHKDLAAWNILGTEREAKAFIDWDDCIMGDSMDDLSLMGVTGDDAVTRMILESYAEVRPLASDAAERFWLCWLRNMVFKAVIRLKAGYFAKEGDDFFLVARGGDGSSLARLTHEKIDQALCALEKGMGFDGLR